MPSATLVGDTTVFPESAVVQLEITFPNGQQAQGTGTMVNANTVLTAGHCVYNAADGGFATSIAVTAGLNGYSQPYGVAYMKYEETFNSFIADSQRNSEGHDPGDGDIGFISLDRDLGNATGWLGFMAASGPNYNVNIFGYPGADGYNGTQMYHYFGALNENAAGSNGFGYWGWSTSSMDTVPGDSGSSLILDINGQLGIIGVLDLGPAPGSGSDEGYAEVTNQTVINTLTNFEAAHPATGLPGSPPPVLSPPPGLAPPPVITPPVVTPPVLSPSPAPTPPQTPYNPPQPPSPMQLFIDGYTLAIDLSEPDGLSAALADAALMNDIAAAPGGLFNVYLDDGFLAAFHGSNHS